MEVTLPPELQQFVEYELRTGQFADAADLVRTALMVLKLQREQFAANSTDEFERAYPNFRAKIAEGLADLAAGRCVDGEEAFDQIERELDGELKAGRKSA